LRHPICSQWNNISITKWRKERKKGLRISDVDAQLVRNGIIITKWRNERKKGLRISDVDAQLVRNGIIITEWRNEHKKGLRISDTQICSQWNNYNKMAE
jgi:predicted DNA-binding transcriptional regulator